MQLLRGGRFGSEWRNQRSVDASSVTMRSEFFDPVGVRVSRVRVRLRVRVRVRVWGSLLSSRR